MPKGMSISRSEEILDGQVEQPVSPKIYFQNQIVYSSDLYLNTTRT